MRFKYCLCNNDLNTAYVNYKIVDSLSESLLAYVVRHELGI